jgi:hypothetical protein
MDGVHLPVDLIVRAHGRFFVSLFHVSSLRVYPLSSGAGKGCVPPYENERPGPTGEWAGRAVASREALLPLPGRK